MPQFSRRALELLDEGLTAFPDDVPAWEAKGQVLTLLGRGTEALAAFEAALNWAPRRELALHGAALLSQNGNDRDRAVTYWHRAVDVDPWEPGYRGNLALLLADAGRWNEARTHARAWLAPRPRKRGCTQTVDSLLARGGRADGGPRREGNASPTSLNARMASVGCYPLEAGVQ